MKITNTHFRYALIQSLSFLITIIYVFFIVRKWFIRWKLIDNAIKERKERDLRALHVRIIVFRIPRFIESNENREMFRIFRMGWQLELKVGKLCVFYEKQFSMATFDSRNINNLLRYSNNEIAKEREREERFSTKVHRTHTIQSSEIEMFL